MVTARAAQRAWERGGVQWTGDNYAEIEALGLPGLRRMTNPNVLRFDGPVSRRYVFPGDWLIPETVTSWRVSIGPSAQEPGSGR